MKQLALDIGLATGPRLSNFFAGPNQAALVHLHDWVAQRPAVPVYVWGPPGSGKSHLLLAAEQALHEQGAQVGWLDAHTPPGQPFNPQWVAVVMDDVSHYSPEQQHTAFNWFVNASSPDYGPPRAILSAGELPAAQLQLREDLRTRLGWGLVFGLQVLQDPERRAVLRQAAQERGVWLSDEVMAYMLNRFSRDLGSLIQLLDALDHYALQTQRAAITIPLLKSMLEDN